MVNKTNELLGSELQKPQAEGRKRLKLAPITIVSHAKLINPQAVYLKGRQEVKSGDAFFI
jgi:hypothetical protein